LPNSVVKSKLVPDAPLQRRGADGKRARLGQALEQDRVVVTLAGAVGRGQQRRIGALSAIGLKEPGHRIEEHPGRLE